MTETTLLYILLALAAVAVALLIVFISRQGALRRETRRELEKMRTETQKTIQLSLGTFGEAIGANQRDSATALDRRMAELNQRFSNLAADNNRQLEQMRSTVDERLQKTLEDRIGQSFKQVSERLEQVYRGLGEMQTLAAGVGDLKKVLSNVKTRGILGEVQLAAILEQILAPEQYAENVRTKSTGSERVEFAVKLPGDDEGTVWLPIDAKFPGDAYAALMDAYDSGEPAAIEAAGKNLEKVIRAEAKDIRDKYLAPGHTTDFGVMFLPVEGLYAEVVRRGTAERLQREYKIVVAGPTTMAALLNSLQMGFKTLAIQKRSSEVWKVLGSVKAEFDTFGQALAQAQNRLNQASSELENLVGVRTRQIQRKLQQVTLLPGEESGEEKPVE